MDRTIITKDDLNRFRANKVGKSAAEPGKPVPDEYITRLYKYIPADIIAVYLTIKGFIESANNQSKADLTTLHWIIVTVLLVATPFYLIRIQNITKWQQALISSIALLVWIFYLGGPFTSLSWYEPTYGYVLLPIFTFITPLFEPKQ